MGLNLADRYYLTAKSGASFYTPDWQEVCENLSYALSYNENHKSALTLLGKIYAKEFSDYEFAFECFDKVLGLDTNFYEVYYHYIRALILKPGKSVCVPITLKLELALKFLGV